MRSATITSGAAGMFCGSCMHDNTLVAALHKLGHDALLIPTYTPIRTDEDDVSQQRVFFGGINVFLQDKLAFFRHTPWFMDRLLDARRLLNWVSRFAVKTQAEELGELTISMLQGEHGHLAKEVEKLVYWLRTHSQPDVINLSNVLISGIVPELKRELGVPILATLQGDDIFLDALPDRYRERAIELIRGHCRSIDGFLTTSEYYADFMTDYLGLQRERIHVVYPGLNLAGHGGPKPARQKYPYQIGYFARVCPEKGLRTLAQAFILLRNTRGIPPCRLRISGWLGENQQAYFDEVRQELGRAGLGQDYDYVPAPDHASKVAFLQSLDVLSVPTMYREPKGLYLLEAWANGVPVVQPRHGSFPELIAATGGGLLVAPDSPDELARGLLRLIEDDAAREEMGRRGQEAVRQRFHAERMARETLAVYEKYVRQESRSSKDG